MMKLKKLIILLLGLLFCAGSFSVHADNLPPNAWEVNSNKARGLLMEDYVFDKEYNHNKNYTRVEHRQENAPGYDIDAVENGRTKLAVNVKSIRAHTQKVKDRTFMRTLVNEIKHLAVDFENKYMAHIALEMDPKDNRYICPHDKLIMDVRVQPEVYNRLPKEYLDLVCENMSQEFGVFFKNKQGEKVKGEIKISPLNGELVMSDFRRQGNPRIIALKEKTEMLMNKIIEKIKPEIISAMGLTSEGESKPRKNHPPEVDDFLRGQAVFIAVQIANIIIAEDDSDAQKTTSDIMVDKIFGVFEDSAELIPGSLTSEEFTRFLKKDGAKQFLPEHFSQKIQKTPLIKGVITGLTIAAVVNSLKPLKDFASNPDDLKDYLKVKHAAENIFMTASFSLLEAVVAVIPGGVVALGIYGGCVSLYQLYEFVVKERPLQQREKALESRRLIRSVLDKMNLVKILTLENYLKRKKMADLLPDTKTIFDIIETHWMSYKVLKARQERLEAYIQQHNKIEEFTDKYNNRQKSSGINPLGPHPASKKEPPLLDAISSPVLPASIALTDKAKNAKTTLKTARLEKGTLTNNDKQLASRIVSFALSADETTEGKTLGELPEWRRNEFDRMNPVKSKPGLNPAEFTLMSLSSAIDLQETSVRASGLKSDEKILLKLKNLTDKPKRIFLPQGTVFDPAVNDAQRLVVR